MKTCIMFVTSSSNCLKSEAGMTTFVSVLICSRQEQILKYKQVQLLGYYKCVHNKPLKSVKASLPRSGLALCFSSTSELGPWLMASMPPGETGRGPGVQTQCLSTPGCHSFSAYYGFKFLMFILLLSLGYFVFLQLSRCIIHTSWWSFVSHFKKSR